MKEKTFPFLSSPLLFFPLFVLIYYAPCEMFRQFTDSEVEGEDEEEDDNNNNKADVHGELKKLIRLLAPKTLFNGTRRGKIFHFVKQLIIRHD